MAFLRRGHGARLAPREAPASWTGTFRPACEVVDESRSVSTFGSVTRAFETIEELETIELFHIMPRVLIKGAAGWWLGKEQFELQQSS